MKQNRARDTRIENESLGDGGTLWEAAGMVWGEKLTKRNQGRDTHGLGDTAVKTEALINSCMGD